VDDAWGGVEVLWGCVYGVYGSNGPRRIPSACSACSKDLSINTLLATGGAHDSAWVEER
jgi:hypothetical protein